jgi:hypothetical protein
MDNKINQGNQSTARYPLPNGFMSTNNQMHALLKEAEIVDDICHLEGRRE